MHAARPILPSPCAGKLKHKHCNSISQERRVEIYSNFRKLTTIHDQRHFIVSHVQRKLKKRTTRNLENSRKTYTNHYSFTVGGEKQNVCRDFFMATLNVTDALIRSSLNKYTTSGTLEDDKRGKHTPKNKASQDTEKFLRDHILSYPAVESHYCRKSSTKKYLDSSLNISIMHRMYKEACSSEGKSPVSLEKYRLTFNEYNLGFHKPKKDQCKVCECYRSSSPEYRDEALYNKHIKRKDLARLSRDHDKQLAKEDESVLAINFDLEAVLNTPKTSTGQVFYLRKLAVYNLTVYNLNNKEGKCFLWDETQGRRGAIEIASCLYNYIMDYTNKKSVFMMSDSCGGQNKNRIFAAMCLLLIQIHPTVEKIRHSFFEPGHSEMECDSIHSKIEKKSKHVPVYVPEGWAQIIRMARHNPFPFVVKKMTYDEFLNFNLLSSTLKTIPWRQVCCLEYRKTNPFSVYFKKEFDQDFTEVTFKTKGRPGKSVIPKAYSNPIPIAPAKLKDLQTMCKNNTIPKEYHSFYNNLKSCSGEVDKLPEPDDDENSDYESS